MSQYSTVLFFAVIVLGGFFMFRSMKKQQQKIKQAQDDLNAGLQSGTRVMLTSGIYGTVRHVGEKQIVIEISPGVDLTVLKQAVKSIVSADEDEFEYSETPDTPAISVSQAPPSSAVDMAEFEKDFFAAGQPGATAPDTITSVESAGIGLPGAEQVGFVAPDVAVTPEESLPVVDALPRDPAFPSFDPTAEAAVAGVAGNIVTNAADTTESADQGADVPDRRGPGAGDGRKPGKADRRKK